MCLFLVSLGVLTIMLIIAGTFHCFRQNVTAVNVHVEMTGLTFLNNKREKHVS